MNSLVHPVPDEQREEPGHLLIRQLAVEHLLSFPRPNGGRLSAEQLEPPELPVHLLVGLFHPFPPFGKDLEAFQGVWVNFFPSLIGDCHPEGVEEDWRRGINRFSLRFLCWCGRRGMIKGEVFLLFLSGTKSGSWSLSSDTKTSSVSCEDLSARRKG